MPAAGAVPEGGERGFLSRAAGGTYVRTRVPVHAVFLSRGQGSLK